MNIKFLKAQRTSPNSVDATYSIDGVEFTVDWNNIHPGTGDIVDYDLGVTVKSSDQDLALRVSSAIKLGETDDNADLGLYLFVRDTFNSVDCAAA